MTQAAALTLCLLKIDAVTNGEKSCSLKLHGA
jgi:hypothetical protein